MQSPLLSINEARRYLGGQDLPKSRDYIYRLLRDGELESLLLSPRSRRITRASLEAFLARLTVQTNATSSAR